MKILIFTCLCQCATHCCNVVLHPLQLLLVLSAAHNEGKDVFLQLKACHSITLLSAGKGQKDESRQGLRHRTILWYTLGFWTSARLSYRVD